MFFRRAVRRNRYAGRAHGCWLGIHHSNKEGAFCVTRPPRHFFTNSFQSAISCELRMKAMAGISFGARGGERSLRPASWGSRSALRWFTSFAAGRKHGFLPPVITYFLLIQVNTVAAPLFEKALVRKLSTRSFSTSPKSRRTPTLTTRPANSFTGRNSSIN